MILQFLLVFAATVIVDWLWGLYIIHTSNKSALKASIYGTLIALMGSFVTISYMQDRRNLIAVAFGAFIGTYLSIKFSKKKKDNETL